MRALAAKFVCAADEVHFLQTKGGPECELFQTIAEQGHYAGRTKPTSTRQGIYAAAAGGTMLASINSNSAEAVAEMLEKALAAWEKLPAEKRKYEGELKVDRKRAEDKYPEGGLVLRVNARDLPREDAAKDWRGQAWNQDFAWFTKAEAAALAAEGKIPEKLVRRLARHHLLDNVRGQIPSFSKKAPEKAELTASVVKRDGDRVELRYEGATRTEEKGRWSLDGWRDEIQDRTRGYEATLLGFATFNVKSGRFESFKLVAVGSRWGGATYNGRKDDPGPAPMGVAFTLAGDTPAERVAPAGYWSDYFE